MSFFRAPAVPRFGLICAVPACSVGLDDQNQVKSKALAVARAANDSMDLPKNASLATLIVEAQPVSIHENVWSCENVQEVGFSKFRSSCAHFSDDTLLHPTLSN